MREIKFDAIYKPTGEHFMPYKIDFNNNTVTGSFDGKNNDWCLFSLDGKYGDVILRQYTGLKDKNGKEIYKRDIVSYFGIKYEVLFRNGAFGWMEDGEFYSFNEMAPSVFDEFEVIGNVYENPELLEEQE